MNSIRNPIRHQLLLDRLTNTVPGSGEIVLSRDRLTNLKQEDVATIFIISSENIHTDEYARLVNRYESEGFRVRNIFLGSLGDTSIPNVKIIVDEIRRTFRRESCMVISYGRSFAPLIIACYYVYSGATPSRAITRVKKMDQRFLVGSDEVAFIYKFKHFLSVLKGISDDEYIFKPLMEPEEIADIPPPGIGEEPVPVSSDDLVEIEDISRELRPIYEKPVIAAESLSLDIPMPEDDDLDAGPYVPVKKQGRPVEKIPAKIVNDELMPAPGLEPPPEPGPAGSEKSTGDYTGPEKSEIPGITPASMPGEKKITYGTPVEAPRQQLIPERMEADPGVYRTGTRGKQKLGIYSIRFKLVSIISAIIIAALTAMIFLATYFFKRDNELRAWESNQKFSEVTALKVKSDFTSIIERSRLIPGIINRLNADERGSIWDSDEDFLFIGIAEQSGREGRIRFIKTIYNQVQINKSGISAADIQNAVDAFGISFSPSFKGEIVINNISRSFRMPVTGFSLPLYRDIHGATDKILVSFIRLDRILKTFRSAGLVNVFMVNDRGDCIAHSDGSMVISGGNFLKLPIVRLMMKSPLDNGQMRYNDGNGTAYLGSFKKIGIGGCGIIATIQESRAYEQVYRIQRWNFYLLVIILTLAIMIVYIFGKTLATPIGRLVTATEKIKKGNYSIDIMPSTRDEVGLLTDSFIEMGKGLAEREKMKEAFGKFVNKEIAERVLKGEIALGGERKNVAIFFSDIRNFTAISEKLEPEEVVEFLNEYMTRMVNCVNETSGVVDKYIGDAIMAVWGAPVSTGNDTANAINAALAMRQELIRFNSGRGGDRKPIIRIGCGINTGPVLAGQIGSEERMEYTVIGDAVNLASRIETLNKPFGTDILISEDALMLVKGLFRTVPMQKITVKGKADPQQIYAVLGRIDDTSAPAGIEDLRSMLGTQEQPFTRRHDDPHLEEVKYEIIEN